MIARLGPPMVPCGSGDHGVVPVHLATGELVRLGDPDQLEDAGQHLEVPGIDRPGIARDPDRRPCGTGHGMRCQAHLGESPRGPDRPGRGGVALHHNEHGLDFPGAAACRPQAPFEGTISARRPTDRACRRARTACWVRGRSSSPFAIASISTNGPQALGRVEGHFQPVPLERQVERLATLADRGDGPEPEVLEQPAHLLEPLGPLRERDLQLLSGLGRAAQLRPLVGQPVVLADPTDAERFRVWTKSREDGSCKCLPDPSPPPDRPEAGPAVRPPRRDRRSGTSPRLRSSWGAA